MYHFFYNILKPPLKDLQLHYMDTKSFILSFSEGKFCDELMHKTNLDKTNEKVSGKFKKIILEVML